MKLKEIGPRGEREVCAPPLGLIHTCDFLGVNYCVNFSVHAIAKKWVHNPLLNFSVHAIVDQMAGVNAPI